MEDPVSSRTRSKKKGSYKRRRRTESVVVVDEQGKEWIVIDSDDDDHSFKGEEEEGLVHSVENEEENAGSHVIVDKGENFVEDDESGLEEKYPITIDDSDDMETSDGSDFESGDEENESSNSEDSSTSGYDDGRKGFRKNIEVVEKMLRKAKIESRDETERKCKKEELEKSPSSVNVTNDDDEVIGESRQTRDETHKDVKRKRHSFGGQQSEPVLGDSTKVEKSKRKVHGRVQRSMPCSAKELRLLEMIFEFSRANKNSMKDNSIQVEEKDGDAVHQVDTRQKDCGENLLWSFADQVEPLQKSKSEEDLDKCWEEAETYLKLEQVDSQSGKIGTPNSGCKHDLYLDETGLYCTGLYCKLCDKVITEIKYMCPRVVDRFPFKGSGKRLSFGGENDSLFDEYQFNASGGDSDADFSKNKGTVWDLFHDIKQSLYPHQQEGFEFIWKNLAGSIDLQKLKSADPCSEGGCIISHAPGTGKTRLTIVFLQAYMKVFPKCSPVIVAPASLLLTWEEEFKKWDIGVPFHNLNNPELSDKEHEECIKIVDLPINQQLNKVAKRMVKLCSWLKEESILGISYSLYERLAREVEVRKQKRNLRGDKKQESMKSTEYGMMGQVLRENPGLLVLDEGHTPRNEHSQIWKVLSKVQTKKRIILSGTPFQNNLRELYSTLRLVKPSFPDMIPLELKKFCQTRVTHKKKASEGWTWEPVSAGNTTGNPFDENIIQLKFLMDPFVHVYKGSILQEKLPGLKGCVLFLKPNSLQEEILQSIDSSQNPLDIEHKLALVSVHPSLFLRTLWTKKEESAVESQMEQLEKLKLDPYEGIKTRFLVEFVRRCDAMNEKVLVFSQFIDPLDFIRDQLKSYLKWSEGKEVLHMNGTLQAKQKQLLIHTFNDERSEAKIMLASTKACCEGINLVGASRVVLLDVVWNPSVERQAISRAYRLGQKRVVYTYHLITPTEYIKYCKQAEKYRLSELVFSARDAEGGEPKSCAVDLEDRVLDKMVKHAELKDMFAECVVQSMERDLFWSPSSRLSMKTQDMS